MNTPDDLVSRWPAVCAYDAEHLARVVMPVGGLGTGTVGFGGRGDLRDFEITQHTGKGFRPRRTFLLLRSRVNGQPPRQRVLEGPIPPELHEGYAGSPAPDAGLPRFTSARFESAYPYGRVLLSDPGLELRPTVEAFNPLVPGDVEGSSHPAMVLRVTLHNPTDTPIDATVAMCLANFIGNDAHERLASGNRNHFRRDAGLYGVFMDSVGVPEDAETWGTLALSTPDGPGVSHRLVWRKWHGWVDRGLGDYWQELLEHGELRDVTDDQADGDRPPMASLAVRRVVPAGGAAVAVFYFTWHMPNRYAWRWPDDQAYERVRVGNAYTQRSTDAWDAAARLHAALPALDEGSRRFVTAVAGSDVPRPIQEAALCNLAHLRTQTLFQTADGHFFGWEGGHLKKVEANVLGTVTHVWGYEQTIDHMFPSVSRSLREVSLTHMMDADGAIRCRAYLPLSRAAEHELAAADGQMACVLKAYQHWRLTGDGGWLAAHWPKLRLAMGFCWKPGSWDADADGVMEGCQHNTLDTDYLGPNPVLAGWYLAALDAAARMADHQGDPDFARRCRQLRDHGRRFVKEHLFNGDYFEQQVRRGLKPGDIDPRCCERHRDADFLADPDRQLENTCLIDQMIGGCVAGLLGLDDVFDATQMDRALDTIWKHNRKPTLADHFNPSRSYALGAEAAVIMGSHPHGPPAHEPSPYFSEVMTGFEYGYASLLIQRGQRERGLRVVADVRARYDGRKRNPFDEAEWGHHYARSMIAWATLLAWTGFDYDATQATLTFARADTPTTWFWSTGQAWGSFTQTPARAGMNCSVRVLGGTLALRRLILRGDSDITLSIELPQTRQLGPGDSWDGPVAPPVPSAAMS